MMKRRGLLLVFLSLAMGGVAAWAANSWVQERLTPEAADAGTVHVVVAAIGIPYGTKVEARHVRVLRLPEDAAPEGHFRHANEVEGKVATSAMSRGEILLQSRFSDHDSGSTLAALLSPNMRAVTVRVDDVVGVGGFLLPGNRVDVLAARTDRGSQRSTVQTVLEHIKVLAVDQTASTDRNDPVIVRAVTLEVTPAQSEILLKAREEGSLQLTLRNPLEIVTPKAPEPEPEKVAEPAPAAVPTPRPRQPSNSTITIIRGTKVATERTRT
jgi:pilus assembly protein CpaB